MEILARGALAGLAATVPMTAVIGAGRAAGLMGTPPPVEITENVAEQAGEDPDRQSSEFQAAWLAGHLGYGAACGVIFAAIRPVLPRSDLAAGLLFGVAACVAAASTYVSLPGGSAARKCSQAAPPMCSTRVTPLRAANVSESSAPGMT